MAKQLTAFRFSDHTKDNLQEALELERDCLLWENMEWAAVRLTRTDIVQKAIDYYLSHLLTRKNSRKAAAASSSSATKRAKR